MTHTKTATFSLGCFWGPEDYFSKLSGVLKTAVGYSGGTAPNPTYKNLGDHTETVQIEFDPEKISYRDLLRYFWNQHDPTVKEATQYKSIIFYHNEDEHRIAEESKKDEEKRLGAPVVTEIRPISAFYKAEDYHQKYLEKQRSEQL